MHGDHELALAITLQDREPQGRRYTPGYRSIALIGSDLHPLGFRAALDDLDGNRVIAGEKSGRSRSMEGLRRESTGSQQRIVRTLSAQLLSWLAETESAAAHFDAALDAVRQSIDGYEVLRGELPYVPDITANLGESYLLLGRVRQQKGELTAAITALQKSRSILTPLHTADPHHSHLCTLLALNFLTAARIHRQRGEQEAAQAALTSAAALGQRVTSESLLIAQDVRVQVLLALGRQEEARPLVEHLVALG